jgi:hypothetical protein
VQQGKPGCRQGYCILFSAQVVSAAQGGKGPPADKYTETELGGSDVFPARRRQKKERQATRQIGKY